jgi:hypothetical protein
MRQSIKKATDILFINTAVSASQTECVIFIRPHFRCLRVIVPAIMNLLSFSEIYSRKVLDCIIFQLALLSAAALWKSHIG